MTNDVSGLMGSLKGKLSADPNDANEPAGHTRLTSLLDRLLLGRRRLRALALELNAAEARERERLAAALHDDLGQLLVLLRLKLGQWSAQQTAVHVASNAGNAAFINDPDFADRSPLRRETNELNELRDLLAQAVQSTRSATFNLRVPLLQQQGLRAAIEDQAQRLRRLCGLTVEVSGHWPDAATPEATTTDAAQAIVFRVLRELLLNAHKHARARRVRVLLGSVAGRPGAAVIDDGVGFARAPGPWRCSAQGGFGLASAEAQMVALGGGLSVRSHPGRGTRALLWLPAPAICPAAPTDLQSPRWRWPRPGAAAAAQGPVDPSTPIPPTQGVPT